MSRPPYCGRSLSHRAGGSSNSSHMRPPNLSPDNSSRAIFPFNLPARAPRLVRNDMAHICMVLSFFPPSAVFLPLSGLRSMQPIFLRRNHLALALLPICLLARSVAARRTPDGPHPANPYLDPKDDPNNPFGYIPSNVLAGLAFGAHARSKFICRQTEW
jgi:hypothetical protein